MTTTNMVLQRARLPKAASAGSRERNGPRADIRAYLLRDPPLTVAALGLAGWLILAAGADVLADHVFQSGLLRQDLAHVYTAPTRAAPALWLGTDELGRSEIVRLLYVARVSLAVCSSAAILNIIVGLGAGIAGGYFRGRIDDLLRWIISTLQAIPRVVLLLAISALFTPGPVLLVVVLGVLSWPRIALFCPRRDTRTATSGVRDRGACTGCLGLPDHLAPCASECPAHCMYFDFS